MFSSTVPEQINPGGRFCLPEGVPYLKHEASSLVTSLQCRRPRLPEPNPA